MTDVSNWSRSGQRRSRFRATCAVIWRGSSKRISSGLKALLVQVDGGRKQVIVYASHRPTGVEAKCYSSETECLTLICAVEEFRPHLYRHCVTLPPRVLHWSLKRRQTSVKNKSMGSHLQQYDFEIIHRKATANTNADWRDCLYSSLELDNVRELQCGNRRLLTAVARSKRSACVSGHVFENSQMYKITKRETLVHVLPHQVEKTWTCVAREKCLGMSGFKNDCNTYRSASLPGAGWGAQKTFWARRRKT